MKTRFSLLLPLVFGAFLVGNPGGNLLAQGYVSFNNRVVGIVIAPVYGGDVFDPTIFRQGNTSTGMPPGSVVYQGPLVAGTNYTAQLWAGPAGTPEHLLTPMATTVFRTGTLAGYIVAPVGSVVVPGVPPGAQATLQMRAWDNKGGILTTWSQVLANITPRGVSAPFLSDPLSTSPAEPTFLRGLTSFNITCLSCGTPPFIWQQPADLSLVRGETALFTVSAYGEYPFHQWRRDGVPIPNATARSYWITNVQPADAGNYSVTVSNSLGGVVSSNALLAVHPPPVLTAPRLNAAGSFSLVLAGAPNRRYALEGSSNFSDWLPRGTVTNLAGQVSFTETNSAVDAAKYFRARLLP